MKGSKVPSGNPLERLMDGGENMETEFKEVLKGPAYKTLAAFANTEGGRILIGIADDGSVAGTDCSGKVIEKVADSIVHRLGVHPRIECVEVEGKSILKIEVGKYTLPVSYNGRYYKRVGNTTREMLGDELRNFFIKGTNWDGITGDYGMDEIDGGTVREFIRMAGQSGRLTEADEKADIRAVLEKLKLVVDGRLTNGAVMLFGRDPRKHFINAVVRIGRFKDDTTIIGDKAIGGNLFKQVRESEEAIKNLINVRYEITGESFVRRNIWDYPLEALREGLLNAIIHRDYFRYNVQTQIKIFNDRIWFFNPGRLPEGMTLEQLTEEHPSVARNPLIMHVFYLSGLVEEYGSGTMRIVRGLERAGLPEPEFREESEGFSLRMKKNPYTDENLGTLGLNERQISAVKYAMERGRITLSEYSSLIEEEITEKTLQRDLKDLVERKIMVAIGEKRGREYRIME